jgi:hypothetical protein
LADGASGVPSHQTRLSDSGISEQIRNVVASSGH